MHLQVLSAVLSIGSLLAPVANAKIDGPCSNAVRIRPLALPLNASLPNQLTCMG